MKIGVATCDGCNNSFDRSQIYLALKEHFGNQIYIERYSADIKYKMILIINGCSVGCKTAEIEGLRSAAVCMFYISSLSQKEVLIEKIEKLLLSV